LFLGPVVAGVRLMQRADDRLTALARRVVEPMGYELVGVEYFQRSARSSLLRVYIDHEGGVTLDDCTAVSHQLSGVLDVEDPLPGNYDLEVSSPGLDRPLFTLEHLRRFRGHRARVKLAAKLDGRRNFEGMLGELRGEILDLDLGGEVRELPVDLIDTIRLIPKF
jgi:ribosome maturation factor RimP